MGPGVVLLSDPDDDAAVVAVAEKAADPIRPGPCDHWTRIRGSAAAYKMSVRAFTATNVAAIARTPPCTAG